MGFLKGSLTFSRYHILGDIPESFSSFINGTLQKYAFQELSAGPEDKSVGWTSLTNILDTNFEQASYSTGDFLLFALRIDRKAVPPALLRIKLLEAEKKFITQSGKKRLYQEDRKALKETVTHDLLTKSYPIPSFYDVLWSVSGRWLLLGSHTEKIFEDFDDLFKISFKLKLAPHLPWDPQYLNQEEATKVRSLERDVFLEPRGNGDGKKDPSFLGREFLTWLWFKSEERGGNILMPDGNDVEVLFERRLVLESGDGDYSETVVCQGLHADLKEGKAAIREGKKIKEARIRLTVAGERWEFTLKADSFYFQSMKLPQSIDQEEESEGAEGKTLERVYLVEKALNTVDRLFAMFLAKRLSPQWPSEEIPRMRKWLQM